MSPDGKLLIVSGLTSELLVLDPVTGETKQRVALPNELRARRRRWPRPISSTRKGQPDQLQRAGFRA